MLPKRGSDAIAERANRCHSAVGKHGKDAVVAHVLSVE